MSTTTSKASLKIRKSLERGHSRKDWLESRHTFSFDQYFDAEQMGFSDLRVINEDWIQPNQGFGMHAHRDMEIITYVLSGAVAHEDSLGNRSIIRPGEIQRMSAGSGILHSEFNPSNDEVTHLLQIWIRPHERGIAPGYEQKPLVDRGRKNEWQLVVSPDAAESSMLIHQDMRLFSALLEAGESLPVEFERERMVWVQVARGEINLGETRLKAGDAAGLSATDGLRVQGLASENEILLFDLRGEVD